MLSCSSTSAATTPYYIPLSQKTPFFFSHFKKNKHHHHFLLQIQNPFPFKKPKTPSFICLVTGVQELAEIAHNKVLIAATISAAIGQLAKPFTSALIDKTDVNFKDLIRSGGFPSSHSSSVVAAATSLGLERGFSDSIFGMVVVFAGIVMYDAQGVRREAGRHAEILNNIQLHRTQSNSIPSPYKNKEDGIMDSNSRTSSSIESQSLAPLLSISEKDTSSKPNSSANSSFLKRPENITSRLSATPPPNLTVDDNEVLNGAFCDRSPMLLKESIGHTEIEVIAGALLGFLVSIAVHTVL